MMTTLRTLLLLAAMTGVVTAHHCFDAQRTNAGAFTLILSAVNTWLLCHTLREK